MWSWAPHSLPVAVTASRALRVCAAASRDSFPPRCLVHPSLFPAPQKTNKFAALSPARLASPPPRNETALQISGRLSAVSFGPCPQETPLVARRPSASWTDPDPAATTDMASQQQVLFAETIAGMKKALKRRAYGKTPWTSWTYSLTGHGHC